ncbi:MAG: hypothetical protein MI922_07615, partial [Bacteroidales bacterium]|nr:hypothetical protein [Bacteroidales bacterium]
GIRLLDVLDIHFYPKVTDDADILQLHRVWFDRDYDYPLANGVKRSGNKGWDNSITKEYIFNRCRDWLNQHLGTRHDVTLGVSEMGIEGDNPTITALWYASTLGVFAAEGVEFFTPWTWKTGMWEVLHLFSRYQHAYYIPTNTEHDELVSAYVTTNATRDALTIILVNRDIVYTQDVTLNVTAPHLFVDTVEVLTLRSLPSQETFQSHQHNALEKATKQMYSDTIQKSLPPLSITALLLSP